LALLEIEPERATHGSRGRGDVAFQARRGGNELWAKEFNEMGIASLLLDSFSGRGLVSTSTDQALLGRLNMILDAYRAFDALAAHPSAVETSST
jgi:hypothetical protein